MKLFEELISKKKKGILKIYLGYAPGVGKTYAMLKDAQRLKKNQIDVVIGYVEPHDRPETLKLVENLECIPLIEVKIGEKIFFEMNLQAILQRQPEIVLIDELAHTNHPGVQNEKRYQDILELLDQGINVISTLNIQHMESVADKIEEATKIPVKERIPDNVLSQVDQIVIVDITMEDLRERLRAGKIYKKEQALLALQNFFSVENLSFLREVCLREGAGDQIRKIETKGLLSETATSLAEEAVLVGLNSDSDDAEILLRKATKLATQLSTRCYAVYVQTSEESPTNIKTSTQRQLQKNMKLANTMGAEVITLIDDNIANSLITFAAEHRIKHVVFGKPSRYDFISRIKGNVIQSFLRDSIGIDVHIFTLTHAEDYGKIIT